MNRTLLKTEIKGYFKDEESGGVINTNFDEYDVFIAQKNQHKEYLKTKEDIASLQSEMVELKRLLVEKIKNG
jgi:hypothetical protein